MTRGRKSERQFWALFAGYLPIDLARSRFMAARRLASRKAKKRGAMGLRARPAFNVLGLRIWADKWRMFGGNRWRPNCATVARSIEQNEARAWLEVARRWGVAAGVVL